MRKLYSLKNFFATCLLLMVGALGAWAQGTTVTFTAGTDTSTGTSIEKDGITISVGAGTFSNTAYYRSNSGSSLTVTSNVGSITKIVFTSTIPGTTKGGPGNFSTDDKSYSYNDYIGTWNGNATSIKFNQSNQVRMSKIEVTYTPSSNVAAPKFSPDSQNFTKLFSVTITAEDGADIYYTTGDKDPSTSSAKYTAPIDITTTTTLKAIAVKDGKNSNVTTATYTYVVNAPIIDVDSKTFSEPFEVTLTPGEDAEDAKIYYTLDGTEPKAESAESKEYTEPIQITKTTTLKAIAWKNNTTSDVVTATYTYKDPAANDGTFAKPYTAEEIIANGSNLNGKNVWVKGTILGAASSSGDGFTDSDIKTNVAIGEAGLTTCIAIALSGNEKTYCTGNKDLVGKELMFYGTINARINGKNGYFGRTGIKTVKAFAGTEESPIASLNVRTNEGYATFVSKLPFYVPEGVVCSTITEADENGVLTINDKYKAGYESNNIVPADYAVLVKADGKKAFNLAIASGSGAYSGNNLLKAGTGSKIEAKEGYYYYKLAYDDYTTREGLGFYWGADNGGAFTVPEGTAYLEVPSTSTTAIKSFRFEDATTGIAAPTINEKAEKVAYTIDGRRVDAAHLTKGLYIVNGKKVIVK